jgi:hypothetical protein
MPSRRDDDQFLDIGPHACQPLIGHRLGDERGVQFTRENAAGQRPGCARAQFNGDVGIAFVNLRKQRRQTDRRRTFHGAEVMRDSADRNRPPACRHPASAS